MSNESNDYDICYYGYEEYPECSFQDDYGKLDQKYQINTQLQKTDTEIHHQEDPFNFNNKEINISDKTMKNNLNNRNNKFKEKKDNFDHLPKKEFSTKNKINREFPKCDLNIVNKDKDHIGSIKKNELFLKKFEAVAKPDFSNWSEDRLKEEIKSYGIRPTSIKNMIKQLSEIWEFLNLSKIFLNKFITKTF